MVAILAYFKIFHTSFGTHIQPGAVGGYSLSSIIYFSVFKLEKGSATHSMCSLNGPDIET